MSGGSGFSGTSGFSGRSGFSGAGTSGASGTSGAAGGASYLVYTALLTQTGTDAPVATVLQNTLGGPVVWTYNDVGSYVGTLSGAFTVDKTSECYGNRPDQPSFWRVRRTGNNTIEMFSANPVSGEASELNGTAFVEIFVYP